MTVGFTKVIRSSYIISLNECFYFFAALEFSGSSLCDKHTASMVFKLQFLPVDTPILLTRMAVTESLFLDGTSLARKVSINSKILMYH